MKKITAALMVTSISALVLLTTSAFAGTVTQIADCSLAQPSADNDVNVTLVRSFAARVGQNNQSAITATVTRETIAGSEVIGVYSVHFEAPAKGILGSEGSYVGEGFSLAIPLTNQTHLHSATLFSVGNQVGVKGAKINEQLLCTFSDSN